LTHLSLDDASLESTRHMFWEHRVEPRHQFGELTHLSSTNSVLSENLAEWLGDQAQAQVMGEVSSWVVEV